MKPLSPTELHRREILQLALKDYLGETKPKELEELQHTIKQKHNPITRIIKQNLADKIYTQALLKSL